MKRLILSVLLLSFLVFSVPVQAVNYTKIEENGQSKEIWSVMKYSCLFIGGFLSWEAFKNIIKKR
jgi:hypothetical protein